MLSRTSLTLFTAAVFTVLALAAFVQPPAVQAGEVAGLKILYVMEDNPNLVVTAANAANQQAEYVIEQATQITVQGKKGGFRNVQPGTPIVKIAFEEKEGKNVATAMDLGQAAGGGD